LELLKGNEKNSSEIEEILKRSQSTISKHLNMLVDNNLIAFEKKDKKKYYKIINADIIDLIDRINSVVLNINKEKLKDIQDVGINETLS